MNGLVIIGLNVRKGFAIYGQRFEPGPLILVDLNHQSFYSRIER